MGCSVGFFSDSTAGARFVRNTVVGNSISTPIGSATGFNLRGTVAEFSGNVAIGNGTGVSVTTAIPVFRNNTFAGNFSNCGVRNFSGTTLVASNNYWGAATGPGSDPADAACDSSGSTTVTAPFLTADPTQAQSALR